MVETNQDSRDTVKLHGLMGHHVGYPTVAAVASSFTPLEKAILIPQWPNNKFSQSVRRNSLTGFTGFRRGAKPPVPEASLWYGTNPAPNFVLVLG